ncbi:MAG: hypothetical protein QOF37_647 [Thermoleophilaceae bacterium]|nr:hypothetical protein [Thermoleophilaceae bacterium]
MAAAVVFLVAPLAHAAGPGDTLLVSRPAGSGPLAPGLFDWNSSGAINEQGGEATQNVTPDGRYVVFVSLADGLAPGEDPGFALVLRKDLQTGALTVVDAGGNGDSTDPDISADGRYVVFASRASNLAAADTGHDADVFVKDIQTGTVTLLSPTGAGSDCIYCLKPVVSSNGTKVAFSTTSSMAAGDANGKEDVYVLPTGGGTPVLASAQSNGTDASTGRSFMPSLTDDGSEVAYVSTGKDIDAGDDTTTDPDLYVRVLSGPGSFLASAQNGNSFGIAAGGVEDGQISGDGASVVFSDTAHYLATDTDTTADVYRRTLATPGTDTLMSVNSSGTKVDGPAFGAAIDSTGRHVAFLSSAANLGVAAGHTELFVRDALNSTTSAIASGAGSVTFPALAHGGGDHIVFTAAGPRADGPSADAVHMASLTGSGLTLVSRPAAGDPLAPGLTSTGPPSFQQDDRRVSADGRYVVFASAAPALGGPAGRPECWRRDLRTGELLLVSTGPGGPVASCSQATVSGDGQRVAFVTGDPLASPDTGTDGDVYVHDVPTGTNTLVTRADGAGGVKADGSPHDAEISGDGRHVAFSSSATNLGVTSGGSHVYLRDLAAGTTKVVDLTTSGAPPPMDLTNTSIGVDADGGRVAFATSAKLDPAADTDTLPDVYVRDLTAGTTTLASVQSAADGGAKGSPGSLEATISEDGRRVAFLSGAQNLVPALAPWPTGASLELFVRDLADRTTTMASAAASGTTAGNSSVGGFSLDATGGTVAFAASGGPSPSNLAAGLDADLSGVLVRNVGTSANQIVLQPGAIGGGSQSGGGAVGPALSADGRCVTYYASGRNAFPGVSPDFEQLYLRVIGGDCGTVVAAPGGGGGPGPGGARLSLSNVSMSSRRFRVGRKPTVVAARKKVPVGTAFRFTLNQSATVTIRIDRLTKGRRVKKRCLKPTRKRRHGKPCQRATKRGTLTRRNLPAGSRKVQFSGRLGTRKLTPGSYRATLTATAAGVKSTPVALRFAIVR